MVAITDVIDLGKMLGSCADAIAKLGDSIAHLVKLGVAGFDATLARRTRSRLVELDAFLTQYLSLQQGILGTLDEFISQTEKLQNLHATKQVYWIVILEKIKAVSICVENILTDINRERSDFVLEPTYGDLITTLHARLDLFERLSSGPEPQFPEELAALRVAANEWDRLRSELERATATLSTYLKNGTSMRES